jgi:hypothetical protein
MIDAIPPGKPGAGLAKELNHLTLTMASILVDMRKTLTSASGDPAGSRRLSTAETLKRLDQYEDPSRAEHFTDVSDGDLVKLTKQAIKLRQAAMTDNKWSPPASPDVPPTVDTQDVPGPLSVVQQPQSPPPDQLGVLGSLPSQPQP